MPALHRLAGGIVLGALAGTALAQQPPPLKLPRTQGEIRALLRETGDLICLSCGVVASVRQIAGPQIAPDERPLPGSSNVDQGVGTLPLAGSRAKTEREALTGKVPSRYEVVVRLDDGNSARFELAEDPKLQPGYRVKVTDGKIERYP